MLLLINVGSLFVSSGLLNNELHLGDLLSHSRVELNLDGVDMGLQVLTEPDELRQWLFHALLNVAISDGECYTAIGGPFSVLHSSRE